jgi:hypothetical protein
MIAFTAVTRRYDSDGRRVLRRYRWQLSCARCRKRPELGPGSRRRDRRRCDHLYSGWCAESCRGERLFRCGNWVCHFRRNCAGPEILSGRSAEHAQGGRDGFRAAKRAVDLRNSHQWWTFKFGAKGGSHLCAPNYCRRYRPAAHHPEPVDTSTSNVGFRCIVRPGASSQ